MSNHWNEANGGLRGSTFLRAGAIAYLIAALAHFGARVLVPGATGPDDPYFMAALLLWDGALFLLAAGFLWTGFHPFMSRYGIAVGLFIGLQALYLLVSLVSRTTMPIPPSAITVGRTLLVGVFAIVEFNNLSRQAALLLGLGSALQFSRVLARGFGVWPDLGQPLDPALSAFFMVVTAGGLYLVSRSVYRHEETWALANQPMRNAKFSEFNNPQHSWNAPKGKETPESKQTRV